MTSELERQCEIMREACAYRLGPDPFRSAGLAEHVAEAMRAGQAAIRSDAETLARFEQAWTAHQRTVAARMDRVAQDIDDTLTTWMKMFSAQLEPFADALARLGEAAAVGSSRMAELRDALTPRRRLVVHDPALRWARTPRELARQLVDIVKHEFWQAYGRPERSPGARWTRVRR